MIDQDEVFGMPEFEARRRHMNYKPRAPSSEANPKEFAKVQDKPAIAIECGRPLETESSVPASLYDEILCKLQHDLRFAEPTPADKAGFQELRGALVGFFEEEKDRKHKLQEVLTKVIGHHKAISSTSITQDLPYNIDGDLREEIAELGHAYVVFLEQVRNETIGNPTDPFFQGICHYRSQHSHFWAEDRAVLTNYPAIILMHFGT